MADQVFDLTQTGQQVQNIINDASKVKNAGAQTTLTTESVLLKDVNGNYHKILKSSFTEAIRNTLAGLLVNNDKGTTISRIAAIASGDFGSITPTNLASVLGAPTWIALTSTSDLNECLKVGAIYFNDGVAITNMLNLPSNISRYFCVWTVRQGYSGTAANRYIQFCQDFSNIDTSTNLLHLYFRLRFPPGNWSQWNEFTTKLH